MIDRETLSRWRASAGIWAHFIKPSLLVAEADSTPPGMDYPETLSWSARVSGSALVIELPALEALAVGVALARMGWAAIPMFNTTSGLGELLPTRELVLALRAAALELPVAAGGPPAFLLDAYRQIPASGQKPRRGDFDNRWYVFESDFPSESFLMAHGVNSLAIVTRSLWIAGDLLDALARYQQIELSLLDPETGAQHPFPPTRSKFRRWISAMNRYATGNPDGTFGRRYVPSHG
jgi:hypothetical protein